MKLHLKRTSLLAASLLIGGKLLAQSPTSDAMSSDVKPFAPGSDYRTWSLGLHGGAMSGYSVFQGKGDWTDQNYKYGYGAYIKKQFLHSFGIQANFFRGQLAGSGNRDASSTNINYKTNIDYAVDLSTVITLANINWRHEQGVIQPYLSVGGGYMGYRAATYDAAGKTSSPSTDATEFYIPLGAGLKFNVSRGVNIDLGYQVNFVNNDKIDGSTYGSTFDKFQYAHIGLEFALGKSSKPQLATHNPVAAMRKEYTTKEVALQNQIDSERAKNEALRNDLNNTNNNLATTNANLAKFTTDTDMDGVPDFVDKCPGTPAGTKVDGSGCPLQVTKTVYITEEDKKVVKDAIQNLEFDLGKATLRPTSFPSLDRVANLLISKNFSLKLAGHTDNTGTAELNMRLSKERAEAIKSYLVSKGANASRIEATGYGQDQPIATNKTAAGRQQNRRVEFTLF